MTEPEIEWPETSAPDLGALAVALLRGVIYQEGDAKLWSALLNLQSRVRDYMAVLGLELVLDEAEGYAFLRARTDNDDENTVKMPRLVVRRPLSFAVSLILALLRKKLAEFDAGGADTRLVVSRDEVVEVIRVFLPDSNNEAKLIDQVDTHLNKIVDLGFLRRLKSPSGTKIRGQAEMFEVRRILKAFVDAQWLAEFDARLASYRSQLNGNLPGAETNE